MSYAGTLRKNTDGSAEVPTLTRPADASRLKSHHTNEGPTRTNRQLNPNARQRQCSTAGAVRGAFAWRDYPLCGMTVDDIPEDDPVFGEE